MDKNILRSRMKKLRADIEPAVRENKDKAVYKNILSSGVLENAEWVYVFVSYGTETDTRMLIDFLLKSLFHRVSVPRVDGKEMEFYEIKSLDGLKPGYNGIPEPASGEPLPGKDCIMVMPGLVFDQYHGRIGYGGGYYDRYIARHKQERIFKTAIAYNFQVLKDEIIEMEPHDIRPDVIITDNTVYW